MILPATTQRNPKWGLGAEDGQVFSVWGFSKPFQCGGNFSKLKELVGTSTGKDTQ